MMSDTHDLALRICQINTYLKRVNRSHRLNMALLLLELAYDADLGTVRVKAAGGGMPPVYILRGNGDVEEITIDRGLRPIGSMRIPINFLHNIHR